jgi:hypothetical protein
MNAISPITHESISRRAHQIWEETRRPDGMETAHWLQAERELHAQHEVAGNGDRPKGKSAAAPGTVRHASEKAPHSADYVHPGVTTDSLHHHRNR